MNVINLSVHDDVLQVYKKIKSIPDTDIFIKIPEHSILFENSLNLKLIKKEASLYGKHVTFETTDALGENIINMIDGPGVVGLERSMDLGTETSNGFSHEDIYSNVAPKKKKSFTLPKLNLSFPSFTANSGNLAAKIAVLGLIGFIAVIGFLYFLFWHIPKADISLIVNSQPLIKSVDIKLGSNITTPDVGSRFLPVRSLDATLQTTDSIETTGEKQTGDLAKGEVTIYNKTNKDVTFKKGTVLTLITTKETLKYTLDSDVTVPKQTVTTSTDPTVPDPADEYGEKNVKVSAESFGTKYNVSGDKNFKVGSYDVGDFVASNNDSFTGGSSKTIKAVSEEDKAKLTQKVLEAAKKDLNSKLKAGLAGEQKLIDSSLVISKTTETYDKAVGDAADTLTYTVDLSGKGYYYMSSDLQTLIDGLMKEFVPEGFELSKNDSDIDVGVVGGIADNTDINNVNLNVKLKTFILPIINEPDIKKKLAGGSIEEGKEYLAAIKNIESYKIEIWPQFTMLFKKFPLSEEKIFIKVTKK